MPNPSEVDRLDYPSRPILMDSLKALRNGQLEVMAEGFAFTPDGKDADKLGFKRAIIPKTHIFSTVEATLFGLNDVLVRGTKLRDEFNAELERFSDLEDPNAYGHFAYYPLSGDIVHFPPERWYRLALIVSNNRLFQDPNLQMEWADVREVFDGTVVGIVGASVGSRLAGSIADAIRPANQKIADPNEYKVTNANRVITSYRNLVWPEAMIDRMQAMGKLGNFGLKNKVHGYQERTHELDPFMQIWGYPEGLSRNNVDAFMIGDGFEPKLTIVAEEADKPEAKMFVREAARRHGTRLIMVTDLGSTVQVDIRPFDLGSNVSLAFGVPDDVLYERSSRYDREPSSKNFYNFVDGLIGDYYRNRAGEFASLVNEELFKPFAGLPQSGPTAASAGGLGADVIARMTLGYKFPERFIVDYRRLEIAKYGEMV